MIVQIYEIQTPQEAQTCIEMGVDHVGSTLLYESDWKQPGVKEAIGASKGTGVKNSIIPLFSKMDTLSRLLDYYQPDFIHLCEDLTDNQGQEINLDEYVSQQSKLKEKFPDVGIIRSIPIPGKGLTPDFPTLKIAGRLEPVSDLFLTDTWLGKGPVKGFIGITGKLCDPVLAKDLVFQTKIPVILGGGLSPENVYEALMEVSPAGADSCTNTNKRDGEGNPIRFQKDFDRVKKFIKEVRRAEKDLC